MEKAIRQENVGGQAGTVAVWQAAAFRSRCGLFPVFKTAGKGGDEKDAWGGVLRVLKAFLFLAVCPLFDYSVTAQIQTESRITDSMVFGNVKYRMAEMRTRIAEAAFGGELAFYTDAKTKKRSKDKKLNGIEWKFDQKSNDKYGDVDTLAYSPLGTDRISKWVLYSWKESQINSWSDVSSIGFSFRYSYGKGKLLWDSKPVIDKDSIICYVKAEDITPMLRAEEMRLLEQYLKFNARKKNPVILQDSTITEMAVAWYKSRVHRVFTAAENGQVQVYTSDSFKHFYPQQNFRKLMQMCRVVQANIPGPIQPVTYPGGTFLAQDIYDSTVCWQLSADSMLGFSSAYQWTITDDGPVPKLKSIGLMYYRYLSGIHLPDQFWMPLEEIERIVQPEDWLLLTDIFNSHLILTINHDDFYREGNGYY